MGARRPIVLPVLWLTRLVEALHGRIHGFNVSVAHVWAEQERLLDKAGQRMPVEDSYIAATARRQAHDRHGQRPRLQAAGAEGLQSVQGVVCVRVNLESVLSQLSLDSSGAA